jgi:hypothetical protein
MGLTFQGALNYFIEEDEKKLLEQKRQDAREQSKKMKRSYWSKNVRMLENRLLFPLWVNTVVVV